MSLIYLEENALSFVQQYKITLSDAELLTNIIFDLEHQCDSLRAVLIIRW